MAFYDVIRCDNVNGGIDWLMYKHPVDEFNNKSRLIVSPGLLRRQQPISNRDLLHQQETQTRFALGHL